MSRRARIQVQVPSQEPASMAEELRRGLLRTPKMLPSKYFYDERGSKLFERITELPEYYLTRAEQALLERTASELARLTRPEELIELGSGSARKTRLLLDAGLQRRTLRRYLALEVSEEIAKRSSCSLARDYPGLQVHALVGDFAEHLGRIPHGRRRLVALLGSTIGNFAGPEAVDLLRKVTTLLGGDDWFLLGTDLVKDRAVLEAAYNDSRGITAEFNRNILRVINHLFGGNFDSRAFEHVAFYNEREARIESYLRSRRAQAVHLSGIGLDVRFQEGELLWTEVSCKYTRASVERMLEGAGLVLEHWFTDRERRFALSLSRRARAARTHASRSPLAISAISPAASSISSGRVARPTLRRSVHKASSSATPIASRTDEGLAFPAQQAAPAAVATRRRRGSKR
jgi:L-histidine N-alpha-methyltransferase